MTIGNSYGNIYFPLTQDVDSVAWNPDGNKAIIFNLTSTAQFFTAKEFDYQYNPYGNGSFYIRLVGPQPFYLQVAGNVFTQGDRWSYITSNATTVITNSQGGPVVVAFHSLPVGPPSTFTPPTQGPIAAFNKTVSNTLYTGTQLALQYPLTFLLAGLLFILALIGVASGKKTVRDLGITGTILVLFNWFFANVYTNTPVSGLTYHETPLTFALYGVSATTVAFLGVMGFILSLGITGAAVAAYRD